MKEEILNLLNVCKVIYHNFEIDIYDEPWSQGDEFLVFRLNGNYIGRIHITTENMCSF